jgi:hypothetical protein
MPIDPEKLRQLFEAIRLRTEDIKSGKWEARQPGVHVTLDVQKHYETTHKHSYVIRENVLIRKQIGEEWKETLLELTETKPNFYEYENSGDGWEAHDTLNDRWLDETADD